MDLSPVCLSHLHAAEGWIELGNWREANAELDRIAPGNRIHPDVLEIRCRIAEAAEAWEMLQSVGEILTQQLPNRVAGWLFKARGLHKMGKTREAYELLVGAGSRFPNNKSLQYDTSVYAAQQGLLQEAVDRLKILFATDTGVYARRSLEDPALDQVWKQIGKLKVM